MKHDLALFVDRLRLRLGQLDPLDVTVLMEKSAPYRTDMLFELGADLSDLLTQYEQGKVGDTAVREAAVAVAAEAAKVWVASGIVQREKEGSRHGNG